MNVPPTVRVQLCAAYWCFLSHHQMESLVNVTGPALKDTKSQISLEESRKNAN